ncbi:HHL267Wp [Eremothecium sinecaudum]|uniref:HHL267Wp n=1 Tax=Eremothecium sinecaudum TaxID=45286 RepID=A0A109V0V5_9SACH|nr:HHL267Wp [Eremothecium sinecaudum]AMD22503.1 HHL267Wp [Eremothecium sinecaudum]
MSSEEPIRLLTGLSLAIISIPQHFVLLLLLGLWLWQYELLILSRIMNLSHVVLFNHPYDIKPHPTGLQMYQATRACVRRVTKIILPWHIVVSFFLYKVRSSDTSLPRWLTFLVNVSPLLEVALIIIIITHSSRLLRRCLGRSLFKGDIEPGPLRINYILLSDTMTSYSKPMMDFCLYTLHFIQDPIDSSMKTAVNHASMVLHIDLIIGAMPFFIRFVQSMREHHREKQQSHPSRINLFNAIKYLSHFPIDVCVAISRVYPSYLPDKSMYWFMLINSCYSFWWDVTVDWKLGLMDFNPRSLEADDILRSKKLFHNRTYYAAIIIDFFIRFTWLWTLMLNTPVFKGEYRQLSIYVAELLRRWIWTFFKIEAEYISGSVRE